MSTTEAAAGLLSEARLLVAPALCAAVAGLPSPVARIASYHFGWDPPGAEGDAETAWGKGVRSALVLGCARAVGGRVPAAVPAAVAVELAHNASLIHDDLIDRDTTRRHRPTVWAAHGLPAALLAGDALFFAAVQALHTTPAGRGTAATEVLTYVLQRLVAGELADTAFEARHEVSLEECWAMAGDKTGALLEAACALGAGYGGATADRIEALARYGQHLGLAFQLVDDYLGLWGAPAATGKPLLADLRRRKKNLPVVYACAAGTSASAELRTLYHTDGPLTAAQIARAARLIEQTGAREWARERAHRHIDTALRHLAVACPEGDSHDQLAALALYIRDRRS